MHKCHILKNVLFYDNPIDMKAPKRKRNYFQAQLEKYNVNFTTKKQSTSLHPSSGDKNQEESPLRSKPQHTRSHKSRLKQKVHLRCLQNKIQVLEQSNFMLRRANERLVEKVNRLLERVYSNNRESVVDQMLNSDFPNEDNLSSLTNESLANEPYSTDNFQWKPLIQTLSTASSKATTAASGRIIRLPISSSSHNLISSETGDSNLAILLPSLDQGQIPQPSLECKKRSFGTKESSSIVESDCSISPNDVSDCLTRLKSVYQTRIENEESFFNQKSTCIASGSVEEKQLIIDSSSYSSSLVSFAETPESTVGGSDVSRLELASGREVSSSYHSEREQLSSFSNLSSGLSSLGQNGDLSIRLNDCEASSNDTKLISCFLENDPYSLGNSHSNVNNLVGNSNQSFHDLVDAQTEQTNSVTPTWFVAPLDDQDLFNDIIADASDNTRHETEASIDDNFKNQNNLDNIGTCNHASSEHLSSNLICPVSKNDYENDLWFREFNFCDNIDTSFDHYDLLCNFG